MHVQHVYTGHRTGATGLDAVVKMDGRVLAIAESLRVRRHSPSGFDWSYRGGGPMQLALAVLLAEYDSVPVALEVYEEFMRAIVARLPQSHWTLSSGQVRAAVEQCRRERRPIKKGA